MAVEKTRVSRNGGGADDDDQLNLGADVALVGDPNDGASIVSDEPADDDSWDSPESEGSQPRQPLRQGGAKAPGRDDEFDDEDSRLAYSQSGEEDDSPRSRSRRARRNAGRRQHQSALQAENQELRQKLDELTGTVSRLATGQKGLAVGTLESQMATLQNQLRIVDSEMANAIKTSDGDVYSQAQKLRDEIVGRMYALKNNRDRLASDNTDGAGDEQDLGEGRRPPGQSQARQQPDPRVADYFDKFCDRYEWFDPQSSTADCNIVRAVDAELVAEGYRRDTPLFWQSLERRLSSTYGLRPNMTPSDGDGEGEGQEDERPSREVNRPPQRSRPPTNAGRSASSGRGGGFRLSDIQTNILREEGLLEENLSDTDKAKRQRIVDKWKRGAASERRGTLQ